MKRAKPMARVNTRVLEDQRAFVKARAKRKNLTEGEVFREIIDFFITNNKK